MTASHLTYSLSCPSFPLLPFFMGHDTGHWKSHKSHPRGIRCRQPSRQPVALSTSLCCRISCWLQYIDYIVHLTVDPFFLPLPMALIISQIGDPHWPGRAGWGRPTREALHVGGTGSQRGPHCAGARRSVGEAQDAHGFPMDVLPTPLGGPVWGDEWRWMAMNGDLSRIHIWYLVRPSISGLVICKITMCHCSVDSIRWFDSISVPAKTLYALHMPWHHSNFADTSVSRKNKHM